MSAWRPRSLFARTALLIAATLASFSLIAWAAIVWTTIIPGAQATAHVLAQRVNAAIGAYHAGQPLPEAIVLRPAPAGQPSGRPRDFAFSLYLIHLRRQLQADLPGAEIIITRTVMPTEIWVHTAQIPGRWLVLTWQVSRPETPLALIAVVLLGALLVLVGAALFARRLTAPLADLVAATSRVATGERVALDTASGPSEVRALAAAFQSMSYRLTELDEQRELMLAGLSHDLRSPLARVRVAVELLEAPNLALAGQMTAEIEEIDRMIGQFLHYVRAGYHESPVPVCADDIVRDTLAHHAVEKHLRLELNAAAPRVLAVEALRHILVNLVQNASEYGRPPITVRTGLARRELRLSVADEGPGLSDPEWQEAVRPFQRLGATPGTGHTGLGLAMVERLVRACNGTLAARRIENGFVIDVTLATSAPGNRDSRS